MTKLLCFKYNFATKSQSCSKSCQQDVLCNWYSTVSIIMYWCLLLSVVLDYGFASFSTFDGPFVVGMFIRFYQQSIHFGVAWTSTRILVRKEGQESRKEIQIKPSKVGTKVHVWAFLSQ